MKYLSSSFNLLAVQLISAFLVLILVSDESLAIEKAPHKRPNIVLFIADDMAWNDCGAYGNQKIKTPNIDRLAKQGMRFDNAFLTCSSCSPSRSSIITGRYPHNTGAEQLHWPLPASQITFVELLKASGYYTAALGKWHLGKPTKRKFDTINYKYGKNWLTTIRNRPKDKPFFLWAAFSDPHRPYRANTITKPHTSKDVIVPPFLPDAKEVRHDLAQYYDEVSRLDSVVGMVLKEIEKQGETNNTMVIFISDNGRPFPRCKTTIYDSGIKTPWIVKYPGKVKPNSTTASLVSAIDIAPAILELSNIKPQKSFQGKSFLPILKDPKATIRDQVFAEHNWHDYSAHERTARNKRWKYITNDYHQLTASPPADAVRSSTFQKMIELNRLKKLTAAQQTCFIKPRPKEELYDLKNDPFELKNLATDPKYAKQLQAMSKTLEAWKKSTHDAVPKVLTPDGFDRITGKRLSNPGPRTPKPGQAIGSTE